MIIVSTDSRDRSDCNDYVGMNDPNYPAEGPSADKNITVLEPCNLAIHGSRTVGFRPATMEYSYTFWSKKRSGYYCFLSGPRMCATLPYLIYYFFLREREREREKKENIEE